MAKKLITRSEYHRDTASDAALEEWANDPNTANREECAKSLQDRHDRVKAALLLQRERLSKKRQALQEDPFDPRTEVSEDARKIVKNLWIIFVLLPFVIGLFYAILN